MPTRDLAQRGRTDRSAPGTTPGIDEIAALFDHWNAALQTGDAQIVAALYAPDAVLVPTVSNKVRRTRAEIEDYFRHFLIKKPRGRIVESNIRIYDDIAIDSGRYDFTLTIDGVELDLPCRYSFVYRKLGRDWRIVEHHSSVMPE